VVLGQPGPCQVGAGGVDLDRIQTADPAGEAEEVHGLFAHPPGDGDAGQRGHGRPRVESWISWISWTSPPLDGALQFGVVAVGAAVEVTIVGRP
jgi:hypothetical protein